LIYLHTNPKLRPNLIFLPLMITLSK
jgi:hypothetical protein